jgi:hypothetical protein
VEGNHDFLLWIGLFLYFGKSGGLLEMCMEILAENCGMASGGEIKTWAG